ncbi:MAG TPA: TIGR03000 domain-containing protein [Gemmataceae bacterium]|nr:TIGR03000 domain-containing protein [Gemmataceae bacterium]
MHALLLCAVLGASPFELPAGNQSRAQTAAAQVIVQLPADAKLTFDGHPTKSADAQRWFITPPLEFGKTFHYTLTADFRRGAEKVTLTKVIAVRAGQRTSVSLNAAGTAFSDEEPYPTSLSESGVPAARSTYGMFNGRVAPLSAYTPNDNWPPRAMIH